MPPPSTGPRPAGAAGSIVSGRRNMSSLLEGLDGEAQGVAGARAGGASHGKPAGAALRSTRRLIFAGSLVVVALVVIGWSLLRVLVGGSPTVVDETMMVEVSTGDLCRASLRKRGVVVPATNPRSGTRTLYPVVEGKNGWMVPEVFVESIRTLTPAPANLVVDLDSGRVLISSAPVGEYSPAALRAQTLGQGGN